MLPDGWKKASLEDIAEVRSGIAKGQKSITNPISLPYLRVANVQDGYLDLTEVKTIEIDKEKVDRFSLHAGDVLMNEGGDFDKLGRGDVWRGQITPCLHQNHVFAVRPDQGKLDSYFLANLSASPYGKGYFLSCAKRSTNLASINSTQLKQFPVILPPLPEQKKIAAILSTWDRAIEGTEKLLANSQQQKKALMQQLLTGKKRLPGFTGEWKSLKLKTFLQESIIPSPQPDPKKRITVRLSLNGVEKREVRGTESIDATNYFTRKAGQFIYGKQNIHKGAFGIIPKILDGFETSQDIPCFDFLPNACSAWLFYYLARENIHNTLETKMTGTGSKRLNQKTFLNLTCLAPPLSEQKAIAAVLTTADEEITALESDLSRLRQEKKALMQQLLTGKIRVAV